MRKIADTNELQAELRRLLAYARSDRPSRTRIANELETLSERVTAAKRPNTISAALTKVALDERLEDYLHYGVSRFLETVPPLLSRYGLEAQVVSLLGGTAGLTFEDSDREFNGTLRTWIRRGVFVMRAELEMQGDVKAEEKSMRVDQVKAMDIVNLISDARYKFREKTI